MPHPTRPAGPPLGASWPVLAGLVLAALALRPQVLGIGPLLPWIREDLGVSHGVAGLLATIPVLCMALFAPIGPRLAGRLGPRGAIAVAIGAIVVFGLLRAIVPGAVPILLLTFGVGLGMGLAGPILSIVVKVRMPTAPALATGAYASGIIIGSALAAGVAVPLAGPDGNWRFALGAFSLAGLVSLAAWLVLLPPEAGHVRGRPPRLPWGSPTAWALALVFGLQSVVYYGCVSWIPNVYVERGWDPGDAALLVAILNGIGLVTTIGVPLFADRLGSRRSQLLGFAVPMLAAILGVIVLPDLALLWAIVLGLTLGGIFPIVLTLPVDIADRAADVGAAAALMLLAGYIVASVGPAILGFVRDVTGDFTASLWLLAGVTTALVAASWVLSPARLRRGVASIPVVRGDAGRG